MEDLKNIIIETFGEALEITKSSLKGELNDNTILLDSGLDSLGFAVLVARLEEKLGYDPFAIMEEPYYPTTLSEFINFYKKYKNV